MDDVYERPIAIGRYIAESNDTVRGAAERFGVGKSTVHCDIQRKLRRRDAALWRAANAVLQRNKLERHIRGGEATRQKYLEEKEDRR